MLLCQAQLPVAMRSKVPVCDRLSDKAPQAILGEATTASLLIEGFRRVLCKLGSIWTFKKSASKVRYASFKPPALHLPFGIALLLGHGGFPEC